MSTFKFSCNLQKNINTEKLTGNYHKQLAWQWQNQLLFHVYRQDNQRTEGPESRTDGETLIFWD